MKIIIVLFFAVNVCFAETKVPQIESEFSKVIRAAGDANDLDDLKAVIQSLAGEIKSVDDDSKKEKEKEKHRNKEDKGKDKDKNKKTKDSKKDK